jgi:hypothetical protein
MSTRMSGAAGLDIHKKLFVACSIVPGADRQSTKRVRSFGAMSDDVQQLSDGRARRDPALFSGQFGRQAICQCLSQSCR